ncbi:MAG TPA: histidinol-phosphate transaminase [Bacillota bacterium]|nr:histidinol-phosphate transaminase [Bacillota bacterium]
MYNQYLRDDLKSIKAYDAEQEPYRLKLNANESAFPLPLEIRAELTKELLDGIEYQYYPDTNADGLRGAIASRLKVERENILIGNGSDELLQIISTAFAGEGDKVLCPSPGFGMVSYYTKLAGATPVNYDLDDRFQYSIAGIQQAIAAHRPKILHICTPNNPAGCIMPIADIVALAQGFDGVVVVDEAYYEFWGESMVPMIDKCPNVVVLRTFSKAFGIAGLRVGYLISNKSLTGEIYKIKSPYNVNTFSQRVAELLLKHIGVYEDRVYKTKRAREELFKALAGLKGVNPYPSQANFILVKVANSQAVYKGLLNKGILVRDFIGHPVLHNHLRITVSRIEDNEFILRSMAEAITNMEGW